MPYAILTEPYSGLSSPHSGQLPVRVERLSVDSRVLRRWAETQ